MVPSASNAPFPAIVVKKSGTAGSLTNIKLGKNPGSTTNDFGGDLGELLIFTRQLTSSEEQKVEGYLAHKWGATDSLNADHTYKSVAPIFDNKPIIKSIGDTALEVIKVDFSRHATTPLQDGYIGFNPWGSTSADNANEVQQTYSNPFANNSNFILKVRGQSHWLSLIHI